MIVLFWDIDGTLLTTAKGGMFAWDDGVKEITGKDFQLQTRDVTGCARPAENTLHQRPPDTMPPPVVGDREADAPHCFGGPILLAKPGHPHCALSV